MEVLSDLIKESRSAFDPLSPEFTYTNGVLTGVDYADGSNKAFTYVNGLLTQVDYAKGTITIRKILTYTNGVLTSITESVLTGGDLSFDGPGGSVGGG